MHSSEKISVVIINYNGFEYTESAILSLKNQSCSIDEILVVDDCSADQSREKIKEKFPEVIVKQTQKNSGPGVARNLGLESAKNKKIVFLDNDVEIHRDAIKNLAEESKNNSGYVFFVARVLYSKDKNIIQKEGTDIHYLGMTLNVKNHGKKKDEVVDSKRELVAFPGVCYLVNIENLNQLEKHDESFFYTFEDLDFAVRNHLKGNKTLLVPSAEVYHKEGTKGLSHRGGHEYPSRRLFYFIRNRWFFILKNYSLKSILLTLPLNMVIEFLLLEFSLLKARDKLVYFKSHFSLLKNLPLVLRKRKHPVDINKFIHNHELRLNESTLGTGLTRVCFSFLDKGLLLYGKYILNLKDPINLLSKNEK